jgi:hypothetical protein
MLRKNKNVKKIISKNSGSNINLKLIRKNNRKWKKDSEKKNNIWLK